MAQIIIAPNSLSGLSATTGLSFGVGLILGFGPFSGILFAGTGGFTATTLATEQEAATFLGAGSLIVTPLQTIREAATLQGSGAAYANTIQAVKGVVVSLNAAGGLAALVALVEQATGVFTASGSVSASVTVALAGPAAFAGTGSVTATFRETEQEAATFQGGGSLQPTVFGAIHAIGIFAGAGGLSVPVFSLIFTAASSQYLTNTGKATINTQKFTVATWFKRTSTGALMGIYRAENALGSLFYFEIYFGADDRLNIVNSNGITTNVQKVSSATYTDTVSWHHLCVAVDTTQATADSRVRLYVDGTEITSWNMDLNPAQSTNLNNNYAAEYLIGASSDSGTGVDDYLNGKLSEYYYIDGQQLTPASFITGTPGIPQHYTGTYTGVFDFYLNFSNGASVTTLGTDYSGEGNNWTLNNMTTANQSSDYP